MNDEAIAHVVHEANRAYCLTIGDFSQPSWENAPDWQKESAVLGVRNIRRNPDMTAQENHEGWLHHKLREGWVPGTEKNPTLKTHPCCVPWSELPRWQQVKDELFTAIVKALIRD